MYFFLAQTVLLNNNVTHNVKPHTSRELRRVEAYPRLWARRGVTLCSVQGVTLCKKNAEELRMFLNPDRDAMEAREYVW